MPCVRYCNSLHCSLLPSPLLCHIYTIPHQVPLMLAVSISRTHLALKSHPQSFEYLFARLNLVSSLTAFFNYSSRRITRQQYTTHPPAKMPHAVEFTPNDYPLFPSDPSFKSVNLETISLTKLLSRDSAEQDRVFEACKSRGFFYLELGGCESGETILKGADDICRMAEDFFKLPMEQKEEQRMREGQLDG